MNEQDALYSLLDSGELLTVNGLEDLENGEGSAGVNIHVCQHCNKVFLKTSNYQTHLRTHTGEKPFVCCICMKQFARADYLKAHLVSHSGARPYTCGICEKTFTHVSSLNTHIRIHTGERPYVCHICPRSFTKSSDLQRHLDIHREKLFTCFMCDKRFARIITLKKHLERCNGSSLDDISVAKALRYKDSMQVGERRHRRRKARNEESNEASSDEDYEPHKKRPMKENTPVEVDPEGTPPPPAPPKECNGLVRTVSTFDPSKTTFLIIPSHREGFLVGAGEEFFRSPENTALPLQTLSFDLGPPNEASQ